MKSGMAEKMDSR